MPAAPTSSPIQVGPQIDGMAKKKGKGQQEGTFYVSESDDMGEPPVATTNASKKRKALEEGENVPAPVTKRTARVPKHVDASPAQAAAADTVALAVAAYQAPSFQAFSFGHLTAKAPAAQSAVVVPASVTMDWEPRIMGLERETMVCGPFCNVQTAHSISPSAIRISARGLKRSRARVEFPTPLPPRSSAFFSRYPPRTPRRSSPYRNRNPPRR